MTTTAELRQLHQQATPGPWQSVWLSGHTAADAALIAAMRNALPALLDIAEAAQQALATRQLEPDEEAAIKIALARLEQQ